MKRIGQVLADMGLDTASLRAQARMELTAKTNCSEIDSVSAAPGPSLTLRVDSASDYETAPRRRGATVGVPRLKTVGRSISPTTPAERDAAEGQCSVSRSAIEMAETSGSPRPSDDVGLSKAARQSGLARVKEPSVARSHPVLRLVSNPKRMPGARRPNGERSQSRASASGSLLRLVYGGRH
jgi:hypothetical protein